jgi:hypothetical protein
MEKRYLGVEVSWIPIERLVADNRQGMVLDIEVRDKLNNSSP